MAITIFDGLRQREAQRALGGWMTSSDCRRLMALIRLREAALNQKRTSGYYLSMRPPPKKSRRNSALLAHGNRRLRFIMARQALAKDQIVKLIVGAGQASPSPPVGPALGSKGVKSMDFCKARLGIDAYSLGRLLTRDYRNSMPGQHISTLGPRCPRG